MAIYDIDGNVISSDGGGGNASFDAVSSIGAKIINGDITTISLIGDSITDGGNGTGYNGSSSTAISTNTAGYCWANMFKKYLHEKYGTAVTNYGQYGSTISQQMAVFGTTIPNGTDLVIWLTGTNNRNDQNLTAYKAYLSSGIDTILNKGCELIVMDGIPATKGNENDHTFSMQDIANAVTEVVYEKGCAFIPMYNDFSEQLVGASNISQYYDGYGIHPSDAGYLIMLTILLKKLRIPVPFYDDLSVTGDYYPFS